MKTPRGLAVAVIAAVIAMSYGPCAVTAQRGQGNVRFRWAIAILPAGTRALVPIRPTTTVRAGDRLKMFISPATPLFAYVIYQGPDGSLETQFPVDLRHSQLAAGSRHFIPPESEWIEFDDERGKQTYFVVVSVNRLSTLETRLADHARATAADRATAGRKVLEELQSLRAKRFNDQATAELPVDIGGSARGPMDIDALASDISARDFYTRTITIDHR